MTKHTATGYLILEATRSHYGRVDENGLKPVSGVRIVGYRANRPAKLERDQVTVRIGVGITSDEFSPITAELAVDIDPARIIKPVLATLEPELPA
ncbi:Uncharacterised protein [Mycobacteroides abscessus subsp. massiliense]|uniref:hypothetical protein n=1 Tax=Mycobacteroides abscessus TaxID=36809 RepID=UPI0009A76B23|nr:hypothetical protein [Mycobacteroides abscessus]SKM82251.1 Uncharacterised protein [Mycobacteroides abscessus subsp. massiliense]SKM98963.1 Uncharacterised protein [Mycobacteroides abscessus subsp. massiliense]SKN77563.1 Uncharacterised protein [Mycobacteroides abscessus subsp. massiliense]SKN95622.1 Uncharacterised protein [Mycobacteroides abscessus subsp. massiliense]SKO22842.1 Uncharacterised protein [Mycobacteroides abscessus subsp. massiliense]